MHPTPELHDFREAFVPENTLVIVFLGSFLLFVFALKIPLSPFHHVPYALDFSSGL